MKKTKNLIYLAVLMCMYNVVLAQPYVPLVENKEKTWTCDYKHMKFDYLKVIASSSSDKWAELISDPEAKYEFTRFQLTNEDTIFDDGLSYKKLYQYSYIFPFFLIQFV